MGSILKDSLKSNEPKTDYNPSAERVKVLKFVKERIEKLKNYRTQLKIEDEWKSADNEIIPRPLDEDPRRVMASDDELGLRSRMIDLTDETQEWRQTTSDPMLLVKIQTALSIIIDSVPEAVLRPTMERYRRTASVAKAIWERNWDISGAKEVYKLIAFDVFKYGFAVGRTFPRDVRYKKNIITELNIQDPDKTVVEERTNVMFADIYRERLNPYAFWLDPSTKPYDRLSCNEIYYEVTYSVDNFNTEFGDYPGADAVIPTVGNGSDTPTPPEGDLQQIQSNREQVTVGFYENRSRDLYVIMIPTQGIVLHYSPLINDDGLLSAWYCMNMLRDSESPYGISTWQIIRQDKELYDKMKNMTMDQLVLSIQKMGFIFGMTTLGEDNVIRIVPGKFQQLAQGAKVEFLDIPGPGAESFDGLKMIKAIIDDNSGITPTLTGEVTGKTLGEVLHAKESALKRLRTPLENIAWAVESDVYLTLSWASQVYTTPEIKTFVSEEDLFAFEKENSLEASEVFVTKLNEEGVASEYSATYLPQLDLKIKKDGDKFIEDKASRFFQVGKDLPESALRWQGIVKIVPKSIVSPSAELEKQKKLEVFNIVVPILPQPPEIYAKATNQLLLINDEKPEDWLPDTWVQFLVDGSLPKPLFTQPSQVDENGEPVEDAAAISASGRLPEGFESMQGQEGIAPPSGAPTVLPNAQVGGERPGSLSESIGTALSS